MDKFPTILAIESSCDDTSAAVLKGHHMLSNCIATQKAHKLYGGVVPEVASRAHLKHIVPVVSQALQEAGVGFEELDAIGITRGPGLLGSLIVGVSYAKSLALSLDIPLIEVNHMQAHVLAHFIEDPKPVFPFLCLTVSGGHSQIVKVTDHLEMEVIGTTIDDAAGEAFDKTGKMLGLAYPAGPIIDKKAREGKAVFEFAKPKIDGLNYSFSGLKTSILYFLKKAQKEDEQFIAKNLNDICASVQESIVNILLEKLVLASEETGIKEISIAGGVSANSGLRNALKALAEEKYWNTYIPRIQFCTDNAAMIAMAAHYKFLKEEFASQDLAPMARWKF